MKLNRMLSMLLVVCLLAAGAAMAESTYPLTVTDAAGREVVIAEEPQTLVSGYYISTSVLIAMGLQDKLVGIEAKANSRPIYALAAPELLELPSVGTAKEFDMETCLSLEPDLVVLPLKLRDAADTLAEMGVAAVLVNPEDMVQLRDTVALLSVATGADGEALLNYYDEKAEFLSEQLADVMRPSVYLAGNSSYLSTAGTAMYQDTLIQLGGGTNAAAEIMDNYWTEISYEQLLAWNPEVIVIAAEAEYSRDDLMSDEQLQDVAAVANGRVYALPDSIEAWDSPVPGALLGSLWMANVLHEDVYSWEQFVADAEAFYAEFYGIEIDESLLTK